jgi:hypothetical protein
MRIQHLICGAFALAAAEAQAYGDPFAIAFDIEEITVTVENPSSNPCAPVAVTSLRKVFEKEGGTCFQYNLYTCGDNSQKKTDKAQAGASDCTSGGGYPAPYVD